MMKKAKTPAAERRKFIRLNSVYPVEFKLVDIKASLPVCEWQQGFTNNVSKGGICLNTLYLDARIEAAVDPASPIRLELKIHIPVYKKAVIALSKAVWIRTQEDGYSKSYAIGLKYEAIDAADNNRIMRFARLKNILPRLAIGAISVLLAAFIISGYHNYRLGSENKKLVQDLVRLMDDYSRKRNELQ